MGAGERTAFGAWLQSWRHRARLTQQQLADDLGYDVTYIVKIEGGARPPTRQFLARLSQLVGEPVEALVQASVADLARPPLPHPPVELIGREADVARLVDLFLGPARCVTLVGPPGIGKSRLAMEVAARLDGALEGGAWWVPLLDVAGAADVAEHVRRTVNAPGGAGAEGADPLEGVAQLLGSRPSLLALDNFEHVLEARSVVAHLLGACPRLSVLATSREPLDLASEHCYRVPPLAYPAPGSSPTPGDARRSPAVQLFLARARMARADFPMTDANVLGALAACAQLDGVPLPIVLAAGEVTTMGPGAIARRLREGRRPVGSAAADVPEHHRSVDHAIATSWRALDAGEGRVLAALAVFAGGFTAGAAAAVAGEADDATEAVLARLVRKSLVEARPDAPPGPRFELLESVRRHALARLDASGGLPLTRRRHLDHFLAVSQDGDRRFAGSGQGQALVALDAERDNLAAAFDWALAHEPEEAVALAAALWRYFLRGDIPTGRRWLAGALAAAIEETPARAMALAGAGALAWVSGDAAVAAEALAAAAKLAERLDLPDVAAVAALNDAALAEQQGRLDDADGRFEQARQLYDRLGDRRGRACALTGQGVVCRRRGDLAAATGLWAEALGLFRAVGDRYSESMVLGNLAWAAENAGRDDEAQRWNGMRQRIQVALGDGRGLAATTAALGRLAHRRGDARLALALQRDALVAFQRLGDRPWAASTLVAMGALAVEAGAAVEGLMLGAAAEALWEGMGAAPRGEDEAQRDRLLDGARAALGEAAFAGVSRAGRALTLDEAVEMAREVAGGSDEKPPPPATG